MSTTGNGNNGGKRRRGRPLPTAPDLDALPLPDPLDAPLDDGVEVDEDVGYLYRKTSVARALADALSEVAQHGDVPLEVLAGTMEAFDRAIQRSTEQSKHLAHRARVEGRLEAYQNVEERWRVVLRGAGAIETEANTPLEPDRAVALGDGAALAVTAVDDAHVVQGASFRRKTTGGVPKRGGGAFFPS